MADIIDGRAIARQLAEKIKAEVDALVAAGHPAPGLTVILVGADPASEVYVRRKIKACEKVGIRSTEHRLPADTLQEDLQALINQLNKDGNVHGILCQVPLLDHIDTRSVLRSILPEKDVDGFHPVNVGRLTIGKGGIMPCTPLAVMVLLKSVIPDLTGKDVVVIGKSNIVGKPAANLLLDAEATVTVTHIYTAGLPEIYRPADVIAAAAGAPEMVKGRSVKDGAVIIDVGITRKQAQVGQLECQAIKSSRQHAGPSVRCHSTRQGLGGLSLVNPLAYSVLVPSSRGKGMLILASNCATPGSKRLSDEPNYLAFLVPQHGNKCRLSGTKNLGAKVLD